MNYTLDFIEMSKFAGQREDLVQSGGGNSSVKISESEMLIKASGVQLSDITLESGYAVVNQNIISDFFDTKAFEEIGQEDEKNVLNKSFVKGLRPSIETFLHAITDVFTLHTHPIVVNILTARTNGMDILNEIFPDALLVEYATPGIKLAKEYFRQYKEGCRKGKTKVEIIFLKNHGLIVSAASAQEVINKTEEVICKIEDYLNINMKKYKNATYIYNKFKDNLNEEFTGIIYLCNDGNVKKASDSFENGIWDFWHCPDCIVYCGKRWLQLNENFEAKDITDYIEKNGKPVIIYYQNEIYIIADSIKKAKEIESVLSFSAQVVTLNKGYQIDLLDEGEQNFLLNWEAEKYRQNLK